RRRPQSGRSSARSRHHARLYPREDATPGRGAARLAADGSVPFNGLLVLVTCVALAQVAPSPVLLAGMLLWLAAPLVYLARSRLYTLHLTSAGELRTLRRVQTLAWAVALGSAACLIAYAATWEVFDLR